MKTNEKLHIEMSHFHHRFPFLQSISLRWALYNMLNLHMTTERAHRKQAAPNLHMLAFHDLFWRLIYITLFGHYCSLSK